MRKLPHKLIIYCGILCLCISCSTPRLVNHTAHKTQITVGPGPEDMQLVNINDKPHILVSCLERRKKNHEGDFWLIDTTTQLAKRIERRNEPMGLILRPHGIAIVENNDRFYLYAVHHGVHGDGKPGSGIFGHAILQYEWRDGMLYYKRAFHHPLLTNPNDLYVLKDGSFYVTNGYHNLPQGLGQLWGVCERSTVVNYHHGKWSVVAQDLEFANGVHYLPKQQQLLISTSVSENLWAYKRNIHNGQLFGKRLIHSNIKAGDNFSQYDENTLLLTSHESSTKFTLHAISRKISSPTIVWRIRWDSKQVDAIYYNQGGEAINGGSTAILHNGWLYISQVFEPFIEAVDLRHRNWSTSYDIGIHQND